MSRPRPGDRVRITGIMHDDPDPLPVGIEGTVTDVTPEHHPVQQYTVEWDHDGERRRNLMLLPHDPFTIIGRAQ